MMEEQDAVYTIWKVEMGRKKEKDTVALQGSITRNCELCYLLLQVPCGFIALGRCLGGKGRLLTTERE